MEIRFFYMFDKSGPGTVGTLKNEDRVKEVGIRLHITENT